MPHTFPNAAVATCAVVLGLPGVAMDATPAQHAFVPLAARSEMGLHFIDLRGFTQSGDLVRVSILEVSGLGRQGEPRLNSGLTAHLETWEGSCTWGVARRAATYQYLDDAGQLHSAPTPSDISGPTFTVAGTAPAAALALVCGGAPRAEPGNPLTLAGALSAATKALTATTPSLAIASPQRAAPNLFGDDELPHRYSQVFAAVGWRDLVDWASRSRIGSFASITSIRALPATSGTDPEIERLTLSFDCEKRVAIADTVEYFQSTGAKVLETPGASLRVDVGGPSAAEMVAACSGVEPKTMGDLRNLLGR